MPMLRNTFFAATNEPEEADLEIEGSVDEPEIMELPIDLIQTPGHLIVRCPIAGAGLHDIEISLNTDQLTIHKHGEVTTPEKITRWHNQECFWGELTRVIDLPKPVDPDHTRASLSDGVLVITMPIVSTNSSRVIPIKDHD